MKLKKKFKIFLLILFLILLGVVGYQLYKKYMKTPVDEEVKIIHQIEKYGYSLKENKPKEYKDLYKELEEILNAEEVDEEKYVTKITEMFIYDFYSLNDKTAKTDIGGVDFVYSEILENFLQNAQNTYYKYIENNIYENRRQSLPVVSNIEVENVKQEAFAYGDKTDEKAYTVEVNWSYTDSQFSEYQKEATLIFIHDGIKLSLVELQNN